MDEEKRAATQYIREKFADVIQQADAGAITDAQAAAFIYGEIRKLIADGHKSDYAKRIVKKRSLAVQIAIDLVKEYDIKAIEIFNKRTWVE